MATTLRQQLQEEAARFRALADTARRMAMHSAASEARRPLEAICHRYERFADEAEQAAAR